MPYTDTLKLEWSNPSNYRSIHGDGTGVHHRYATAKAPQEAFPYPDQGVTPGYRLARVEKLWYAKLDPGGFIVPHVDQGPWLERWHYPISGVGYVWQDWDDDGKPSTRNPTNPYRMNHNRPHAVWNPWTNRPDYRVVLIVEYDNPVDQPTTDLIICDMIPEIQTMIDAI